MICKHNELACNVYSTKFNATHRFQAGRRGKVAVTTPAGDHARIHKWVINTGHTPEYRLGQKRFLGIVTLIIKRLNQPLPEWRRQQFLARWIWTTIQRCKVSSDAPRVIADFCDE